MARKKVDETATREELTALVEELNSVLGLDPALAVTKKMSDEDIIEKIKGIAENNVYETDFEAVDDNDEEGVHYYSEASKRVFGILQIEVTPGAPPAAYEEIVEEVEKVVEETKPAKTSKKEKATPVEKAPAKEKKEKPVKVASERYTRANAFADAIKELKADKKAVDLNKLAETANEIYIGKGNKDNLKEAKWYQSTVIPALVILGFAESKDVGFQLLV